MKASGTTVRVLLACAGVLVLFGLVAALLIDTDDDDEAAGGQDRTTTTEEESTTTTEGEEDDDESSSTTSTTRAISSTSSTSTSSTSTSSTSTTRPGATTTTTAAGATTTTVPETTTTVPLDERVADLTLSRTTVADGVLRFSTQNSGPHGAPALELVISVDPGVTILSVVGREGLDCGAVQDDEVRCTVLEAPVGGRVGGAEIEVSGTGLIRATVHSAAEDPDPGDNTVLAAA